MSGGACTFLIGLAPCPSLGAELLEVVTAPRARSGLVMKAHKKAGLLWCLPRTLLGGVHCSAAI